jgi:photosystem II stability/assembly factor-like uncharacterized protein
MNTLPKCLVAVLLLAHCAFSQWSRTDSPTGRSWIWCSAVSGSTLLSVTRAQLFRSSDGGAHWQIAGADLEPNQYVRTVAANDSIVLMGCLSGKIYLSRSGGSTWVSAGALPSSRPVNALAIGQDELFAGTEFGVYRSTDFGASWDEKSIGLDGIEIVDLYVDGPLVLGISSQDSAGAVFRSTDEGESWQKTHAPAYALKFGEAGSAILLGSERGIFRSTDEGATWDSTSQPVRGIPAVGWFADHNGVAYASAVAFPIVLYRSTDQGAHWEVGDSISTLPNITTIFSDTARLFAGTIGGLYVSTDEGAHWTRSDEGLGRPSLFCFATRGRLAMAGGYGIFLSTDAGHTWRNVDRGLYRVGIDPYVDAIAIVDTMFYAGTFLGMYRSSLNTVETVGWQFSSGGLPDFYPEASSIATIDSTLFIALPFRGLYQSNDRGNVWTPISFVPGVNPMTVFADGSTLWVGAEYETYFSTDGGISWVRAGHGPTLGSRFATAGNWLYSVGAGGFLRTQRGEAKWTDFIYPTEIRGKITDMVGTPTQLLVAADSNFYAATSIATQWTVLNDGMEEPSAMSIAVTDSMLLLATSDHYIYSRPLSQIVTSIDGNAHGTPGSCSLEQNYPNPFNPTTTIGYRVSGVGYREVRLSVFDLLGREVAVLVDEKKQPGDYKVTFGGSGLASGVYFYRMQAGSFVQTRKLLLLR